MATVSESQAIAAPLDHKRNIQIAKALHLALMLKTERRGEERPWPCVSDGNLPRILYRGSGPDVASSVSMPSPDTELVEGIFLTRNPDVARAYAYYKTYNVKTGKLNEQPTFYEVERKLGLHILDAREIYVLESLVYKQDGFLDYLRRVELCRYITELRVASGQITCTSDNAIRMLEAAHESGIPVNHVLKHFVLGIELLLTSFLYGKGYDGIIVADGNNPKKIVPLPPALEEKLPDKSDEVVVFNPINIKLLRTEMIAPC